MVRARAPHLQVNLPYPVRADAGQGGRSAGLMVALPIEIGQARPRGGADAIDVVPVATLREAIQALQADEQARP